MLVKIYNTSLLHQYGSVSNLASTLGTVYFEVFTSIEATAEKKHQKCPSDRTAERSKTIKIMSLSPGRKKNYAQINMFSAFQSGWKSGKVFLSAFWPFGVLLAKNGCCGEVFYFTIATSQWRSFYVEIVTSSTL